MKENSWSSFPSSMAEGISNSVEMTPGDEAKCLEEWLSILDKISYSFKALSDNSINWDGPAHKDMIKECRKLKSTYQSKKRIKLAQMRDIEERAAHPGKPGYRSYKMEEVIAICGPIYDKYQPIFDEHKKKVQEGLDLFARHFASFWF